MSLVTLTFGNTHAVTNSVGTELVEVQRPGAPTAANYTEMGKVRIGRIAEFFGRSEICILGELVEGTVMPNMTAIVNQKQAEVTELECKYGTKAANRPGTKVTLMIEGIKKWDIKENDVLEFIPAIPKQSNKPKGKLIIC